MKQLYAYTLNDPKNKNYVRKVLVRCFYEYGFKAEGEKILTNADPETFRKVCERAYCERLTTNYALQVTEEESANLFYLSSLLQFTGRSGCEIIKKKNIPVLFEYVGMEEWL